ncbi:GNAT family N-acetyltransferase [Aquimarina sp. 2201CG5-10]|uniref:GNAT family N-acetyltransferase n=1 Tax=Aquimarina callyspongiae TaxID=3098150 RepID=UPI002AB43C8D|nr:GNAT family N-acetyltransferase [Aquimarina sp. 2201CG5-10]MDY8135933.1 GNAT family N-acetyltransferase [Aquimarina sp. 2201CG5-10]
MNKTIEISSIVFSRTIEDFGTIHLRPLDLNTDTPLLHNWVSKPYASYWGMNDKTIEEVHSEYEELTSLPYYEVFIGVYENEPMFLMEKYKASEDRISEYYQVKDKDYGMHILVAPPKLKIKSFTWNVFSTILEYFFCQPNINRVVVEPDIRNEKIHILNKKAGFQYLKEIDLPEKKAALAFCEHKDYVKAKRLLQTTTSLMTNTKINYQSKSTITHLHPETWKKVNIALVRKAISEFSHELVLQPQKINENEEGTLYALVSDIPEIRYEFMAQKRSLDHWDIDEKTIIKKQNGGVNQIDALKFIVEFRLTLGIPEHLLSVYLEEISSTLAGAAYKNLHQEFSSKELVNCSFQIIEHAMSEGHPCFVANNGRIGFDSEDYIKYAPETNQPFKLFWLAGHKSKTTYTAVKKHQYKSLMRKELGVQAIANFNTKLESLGLDIGSYIFIPVHPWQWKNKILQVFAADIANQNLVFLGESEDFYSAQQSIRTLYNASHPEKMYTKTALSILNMGFMRGLSPNYMKSTPHITSWITQLLDKDEYLKEIEFTMLGEVATVGFQNTYYEVLGKTNPHNKMLSALWRENPHSKIKEHQQLMTMAAFLHVDKEGNSLLAELIKQSPYSTVIWMRRYLNAYLSPLLHCFYKYELVFMPHGENIIMVMDNHAPVKVLMKDITEEVIVFSSELDLPEKVQRLYTETSDTMKILSLFTDVFDCFFRFMAPILEKELKFSENQFWQLVAECIYFYQAQYPELQSKFDRYNLFVPEFDRCCLNRLQLRNTTQMLNLGDPIESLIIEGTLKNPIAGFKKETEYIKREEVHNL